MEKYVQKDNEIGAKNKRKRREEKEIVREIEEEKERQHSAASNLINYFAAHSIAAISSTKDLSCLGIIKQVILNY